MPGNPGLNRLAASRHHRLGIQNAAHPLWLWLAERVAVKEDVRSPMIELLPRLRRFAYALTGSMDHADDLVQDTCERALARMDQWTPGTRLDSWMYRIAQNLWVDNRRAKKARGEVVDIDTLHDLAGLDGRKVTEGRLTLMRVGEEMNRLSPDQRILVALVCVEGLTYKEAAETLELPIGTVMSRLARARQALGTALGDSSELSPGEARTERRRV